MNDKAKELLDDFKSKVKELNEPSFWFFFFVGDVQVNIDKFL